MENEQTNPHLMREMTILILGVIAPMLDSTMTNVAISTIMREMHSTVNTVQWVTTAYVLAMGITVLFTGWAADKFSGRSIYLTGTVIFLIGSIIAGFAGNMTILIAGRLVQGVGGGIIFPLLSTLAVRAAGGKNLGHLMATVGLPMVLAPILGPTIGGFIVDKLNWHWIFYVNIPIAALSIVLMVVLLPKFAAIGTKKHFDFPGFVLLGSAFTSLIIGIVNLSTNANFGAKDFILPVLLGFGLIVAYVIYALIFPKNALIGIKLFKYHNFSGASLILLMSGITVNGAMFLLPLYFQNIRGVSVVWAGIYLIAQGLGVFVSRTQIGKLTDRIGARWVVLISIVIAVVSTLPFVFFTNNTNIWIVLVILFFRGIGQGGITLPIMADSFVGIPKELVSEVTTATRMFQNIGGAFGSAILATVIENQMIGKIPTLAHLTNAYHFAFIWSVGLTLLCALPALWLTSNLNKK